jgi:hypothetical protein
MSIVFGSGISRKSFIRRPKTYAKRSAASATPNRTVDELIGAIRSDEMAFLRKFSDACHVELGKYSQY